MVSMKMFRRMVCGLFCLSAISSTQAGLLMYEGFDYPAGTKLEASANGGIGFSEPWRSGSSIAVSAASLSNAAFSPALASGGAAIATEGAFGYAVRNVKADDVYNFDVDGNTFYVSCLLYKSKATSSNSGEQAQVRLMTTHNPDNNRVMIALNSDERLMINETELLKKVAADQVYFVVLKVVTGGSNQDTIYANVYTEADSVENDEPAKWTITVQADIAGTLQHLRLGSGANTGAGFDEIRLGTSWADVVKPSK